MKDAFGLDLRRVKNWQFAVALLLILLSFGLGYGVQQGDFIPLIGLYTSFFLIYFCLNYWSGKIEYWRFFIAVGIFLRVCLIFGVPNLSDDIYRFIWDGLLINNGYNPFNYLPSYIIEQQIDVPGLTQALYQELNSPDYFTIYPPIAQFTFTVATFLFPNSIIGSAIIMKLFLVAFEIGTIWLLLKLLMHFKLPERTVLWYVLNPLIIIEISGNLHFEGGMIFFLLLAFWCLIQGKQSWSAVAMAFSIASKLLPLMFLPFLIIRLGWERSIRYFFIMGIALLILFLPLLNGVFIDNFSNSLDLYFRKFEFNASTYYLLRWWGYQKEGYNLISVFGPLLAAAVLYGILAVAIMEKDKSWRGLPVKMLYAICLYLLLATTIHPWYVSLPIVFCLFTSYRFPIVWSYLIFLTYINYSYPEYKENLWVVAIEYILVISFFIIEVFRKISASKKAVKPLGDKESVVVS